MKKLLPIGVDDFKKLKINDYYFVDKSLFIKDIIDDGVFVKLITRPRRFGKLLNLSILKDFFEKTDEDLSYLFKDLQIWQEGERYTSRQGQYPVVYLSFKDVKFKTFDICLESIKNIISDEFERHKYILDWDGIHEFEKQQYIHIKNGKAKNVKIRSSLKFLTRLLSEYHRKDVIVLIEEYDIPISLGYRYGYHKDIVNFLDAFFWSGLKGNCHMEMAIVTGLKLYRRVLDIALERPWTKMACYNNQARTCIL